MFGAVFVAEIGNVERFGSPQALSSWAGLTPRHRESDTKVQRGRITKQGSRLVRWAAIEAVARYHGGEAFRAIAVIAERRGRPKANVAIARKVLTPSTTAFETERSAVFKTARRREARTRLGACVGQQARLSPEKVTKPTK